MLLEPEVSIIVVSYNTRDMTLACIKSIVLETTELSYEIIIFDNASTDGSGEALEAELPDLGNARLIRSQENLGFGKANNAAVPEARGRYLLLLNPDTIILDRAIEELYRFALKTPDALIWGGRTVFSDGSLNATNCYREMSLQQIVFRTTGIAKLFPSSEFFNGEVYGRWQRDREREVEVVTGCFLMIERDFWELLGGFDPAFFMFGEETDLCMRARRLGARPRFTPLAQIIHHGGASQTVRAERMIQVMAAKVTLIRCHFSGLRRAVSTLFLLLWPWSRMIGGQLMGFFQSGLRSDRDAWAEVWKRRREWKNGFIVPPQTWQRRSVKKADFVESAKRNDP